MRHRLFSDAPQRPVSRNNISALFPSAYLRGISADTCFFSCTNIDDSFPPIGVWVKRGVCGADSLINIALCCLGFLPGLLHAWYIILQNPDPYDAYNQVPDSERSRGHNGGTTYYVISHDQPAGRTAQPSYGTVANHPGQQSGVAKQKQNAKGNKPSNSSATPHGQEGGEGSSSQPEGPPPAYADAIKGDHKVQKP